MSKYKLHPITSIIYFVKSLKEMIVPLVLIVLANGFNFSLDMDSEGFFSGLVPFMAMIVVLLYILLNGIIKWLTFTYWFEEQELRVQYGLFVKKRRFIPFDRIQTLNYKEGIFHRPFGLVLVKVETAGSSNGKADAEFTAITKHAAAQIELEMNKAKGKQVMHTDVEVEEPVVFKMSAIEQMMLATTSGGIGVIIFSVLAVLTQLIEYLPIDRIVDGFASFVETGVVLVVIVVFIGLVIAWLLSIAWTMISYFDFKVTVEQERIVISHGLLEKKRMTIPLNRVQAVQIIENPLRQLFGFATVRIESAGGGSGEKGEGLTASVKLFPLIKKKSMYEPLQRLFPYLNLEHAEATFQSPKKARPFFYRLNFLWYVPAVAACGYFLFPYGLLAAFIVVPIVAYGFWRHQTARAQYIGNQIAFTYRNFSKVTFIAQKRRIQIMNKSQTLFQKRRQIATVTIVVKSGEVGAEAKAYHMEQTHMDQLLDWYEHREKSDTTL